MLIIRITMFAFCLVIFSNAFASEQVSPAMPEWLDTKSYQLIKEMKDETPVYKLKTADGTLIEIRLEILGDVFLLLENNSKDLYESGFDFGVTRSRGRIDGCRWATNNKYFVGDINSDGLTDIGVIKEEIFCDENERRTPIWTTVPYKAEPLKWYVMRTSVELGDSIWWHDPRFDSRFPLNGYSELPIPGLEKSPVDFLLEMLQQQVRIPSGLNASSEEEDDDDDE